MSRARMSGQYLVYIKHQGEVTGTYNDRYFCFLLAVAHAGRQSMYLVVFNILGFKYFNNTYVTKKSGRDLCEIKYTLNEKFHEGALGSIPNSV